MYLSYENFSIKTFELSDIDYKFVDESYSYLKKFPFKWNFFVNNVVDNPKIFYSRDTTVIININYLEFKKIQWVFEILKIYLKYQIIRKIIYKKEFIIVHFSEEFHMNLFIDIGFLISINLYKNLIDKKYEVYLGGILSIGTDKKIIHMIMKINDNYAVFIANKNIDFKLNEKIIKIYLYEKLSTKFIIDDDVLKFKLNYCSNNIIEKINKLLLQYN